MKKSDLVGSWRLVRHERRDEANGRVVHPLGPKPRGLLMYGADGSMSVTIMAQGRARFREAGSLRAGTSAEKISAAETYLSYAGRFSVRGSTVIHQIEICLFPNWVGGKQPRAIELDGDQLTLVTPRFVVDGRPYTARIVWKRSA